MENQKTFYVCEFHNGNPKFIHYETREYAKLHARFSPYKCRVYSSDQIRALTTAEKCMLFEVFNPLIPSHHAN